MPFSAAVADYQKHRVKKLKKQGQARYALQRCAGDAAHR
jgi:hypothetical protein